VLFPVCGSPRRRTCFDGIERDFETESRIEDHRSCVGDAGLETVCVIVLLHNMAESKPQSLCFPFWIPSPVMSATTAPPAAAVTTPRYSVDEEGPVRTLTLPAWTIVAENHPMSNAAQLDVLDAELKIHLPEMTFGANRINLKHRSSGWQYEFSTKEALRGVKNGPLEEGDGSVKVRHADEWLKSRYVLSTSTLLASNLTRYNRTSVNTDIPIPETIPIKPYDWTYTTAYEGHPCPEFQKEIRFQDADPSNPSHSIPMNELARHDPILFYAQTLLFEDELHDNGSSSLLVRLVSTESIEAEM
jgi:type 2A phosphatase activator TIP41